MKKLLAFLMVFVCLFVLFGCGGDEPVEEQPKALTYAEYLAAENKSQVVIETYIQAKQGWWEKEGIGGVASFYTQDNDGGYFIYERNTISWRPGPIPIPADVTPTATPGCMAAGSW